MYTAFYNFTGRPFQLTPDPRFYFESRTHKKAMAYLTYGLSQNEGFIVITGDIGAGKTTLVGHLLDELDKNKYIAAKVVTTQLDADAILRMVASSLGVKPEGLDKASILKKIEGLMIDLCRRGKRVLLVVDEAQNLSNSALEELRMLSNFQLEQKPLVQCFLLGQPQFRDRLGSDPDLEQVRQRVIATYHLLPLGDVEETRKYITHRLETVGWTGDPEFAEDAFAKIYSATDGVPRKLNTLCSRILLYGFLEELHKFDEKVVQNVIDDLALEQKSMGDADQARKPAAKGMAISDLGDPAEILNRLETLERFVNQHERTINRAIDIAADWLEGGTDDASE